MMCVVELPTIAPIAPASPASPWETPAMPSGRPPSPAAAPEVLANVIVTLLALPSPLS